MDPIVLLKIRFRVRDGLSSELAEHARSPKFGPSPARAGHGACLQSQHLRSQGREVVSSRPVWIHWTSFQNQRQQNIESGLFGEVNS